MDEPRTMLTGARMLVVGILAVGVAALIPTGGYSRGDQSTALCVALGGAALIIAGGIVLAAERRRP